MAMVASNATPENREGDMGHSFRYRATQKSYARQRPRFNGQMSVQARVAEAVSGSGARAADRLEHAVPPGQQARFGVLALDIAAPQLTGALTRIFVAHELFDHRNPV